MAVVAPESFSLRYALAMGWFDIHTHLTDPRLAAREEELLARAVEAGVTTIISNGLNPHDNASVRELARRRPMVRPAFGLYPVDAVLLEMIAMGENYPRETEPLSAEEGVAWVREHLDECVAVGEIGLDHHWVPEVLWARQEAVFVELVTLAMAAGKPMIVHTRKAEKRAFEILTEMGAPRVIWHCFGGKVKLAQRIADAGFYLSIPANARKSDAFKRMIDRLPREQLLLETDAPYLGPVRGELNEPANVALTGAFMAERWDVPVSEVQAQLEANFAAFFGFAP